MKLAFTATFVSKTIAVSFVSLIAAATFTGIARADDPPKSPEDLNREALIEQFTTKMKEANYPALFEKAAQEFGVPSDVLKGIAFAETRWEQLQWPPGETVSKENGMPHPYGIMSLWDNEFFGHSLIEAAKLIGKSPEELKTDAYQNMRGGAALLKKIYDETPKPDYAREGEIERWTYAISKYCGIPERELNAQHAVDIYEWMSQGYHEYGIEWEQRPVNLGPMHEELKKIKTDWQQKLDERAKLEPGLRDDPLPAGLERREQEERMPAAATAVSAHQPEVSKKAAALMKQVKPVEAVTTGTSWELGALVFAAVACLIGLLVLFRKSQSAKKS